MTDGLFVDETGEGDKALVLLHGFAGTHRVWDRVRKALDADLRVFAYDLPGHGNSLSCAGAGKAKAVCVAVLDDLQRRGVESFYLAGHSFGGAVAALMAVTAPERISSLTLFAPGGFGLEINSRLLVRFGAAGNEAEMRASMEAMRGFTSPVSADEVAEALDLRAMPGQREKLVEIAGMIARDGRQGAISRDMLDELSMHVCVVWGELDAMLPVRQARALPAQFTAHIFPDLGHMLPEEAPGEMAAILRRQLA